MYLWRNLFPSWNKQSRPKCSRRLLAKGIKVKNINDSGETNIKLYQRRYFKEEINRLQKIKNRSQNKLANPSQVNTLSHFVDDRKILCVGGRLKRKTLTLITSTLSCSLVKVCDQSCNKVVSSICRTWCKRLHLKIRS